MKALAMIASVVVLSAAGWFVWRAEPDETPVIAEGAGPSGVEDPGSDSVEFVAPGPGSGGTEVGPKSGDGGVEGEGGPGDADEGVDRSGSGPSPQLAAYMQKYGHMTELERSVALAQLTENIRYERNLLFDTKFASGDYITRYPGDAPLPPPETDDKGRPMERDGRTHSDFNGSVEMRHAELRFEEAPDFYRLLEELDWLKDEVGQ